jgi:hypothetical protein
LRPKDLCSSRGFFRLGGPIGLVFLRHARDMRSASG